MPGLCLRAAARVACLQVHSYVAVPQGKTTYLSEVASGASALIASHSGATRTAVVGRAKVERRSLVCLSLESVKCRARASCRLAAQQLGPRLLSLLCCVPPLPPCIS